MAAAGFVAALHAPASAQNGPIAPNLKKALIYFYNYAGDHVNTPNWCGYLMKLGAAHGIQVDTSRNPSVFTSANLSNYQAVILFNAYDMGIGMSQSQKGALHDWYKANRGIACFHQCVKNSWSSSASDNWYDSLMGAHYLRPAGFTTGPVYVDAAVAGTDLAMNSDSTPVAAGASLQWNDEWYSYDQGPAGKSGTRMIWTTKASFTGFTTKGIAFNLPGDVQPLAWARTTNGGRFLLNSLYHTSDMMNTTDPALKKFNDGAFLGAMRWVAGYTGCMDPAYVEYNPKATHAATGACKTPVSTAIHASGSGGPSLIRVERMRVAFSGPGPHAAEIFDPRGRRVARVQGTGAKEYGFDGLPPGMYRLVARSGREAFRAAFLAL